ncbi:helix-turn-helix domain-containing protein [Ralstonia pseudosolanacearum]
MLYGQRYERLRRLLREVRREANLTQIQLAEKLSKGQSYVSKVERGEQYLDVLEFMEWCQACNASPGEVMGRLEG